MANMRIAPETMAVLECLAEGHKPGAVSDLLGVPVSQVYNAKRNHSDVIFELQGKKADGSPARFAPGCGAESIAKMERAEEEETQSEEPRKHSVAELFQEIEALKVENADIKAYAQDMKHQLQIAHEVIQSLNKEMNRNILAVRCTDLLPIMFFDLLDKEVSVDYVTGYLNALRSIFTYDDIRKETAKNARPEED